MPRITEWTTAPSKSISTITCSLLGIGRANLGEQRCQFVEHSVLVRDNYSCCRVIVVGQVQSGADVWAADEPGPAAIGTTGGAVEQREQPLARCPVRRVADQPRAEIEVTFR